MFGKHPKFLNATPYRKRTRALQSCLQGWMAALLASAKLGAGLAQQLVDFIGSFITISDRDSEFGIHEQTDLVELRIRIIFQRRTFLRRTFTPKSHSRRTPPAPSLLNEHNRGLLDEEVRARVRTCCARPREALARCAQCKCFAC